MPIKDKLITDKYAIYNGDIMEVSGGPGGFRDESVHLSIYSPPFATESGGALYHYSSSDRDLSNARTYEEFFQHYEFMVREIYRVTLPGRMSIVHCMYVPTSNSGTDHYTDFPGHIIELHRKIGFRMASPPITIWKEPLDVRNRTLTKALAHKSIVDDSCDCAVAGPDILLIFRKKGENRIPVTHPTGLTRYYGERKPPADLLRYKGWTGNQIENRYSHWIWRQYASCVWDDIRGNTGTRYRGVDPDEVGTLPFKANTREEDDEKHLHPLQLDVYHRALTLWSNPGEVVLEPCMGVGSGVYCAVKQGRLGIGAELKPSYYKQAVKNIQRGEAEDLELDQAVMEFGTAEPWPETVEEDAIV